MLIGKITYGNRERLMVTLLDVKGTKVIDFRVYNIQQDGELTATPAGLSLRTDQIDAVIELLQEAKKKASNHN
jgi:hypothetical protein